MDCMRIPTSAYRNGSIRSSFHQGEQLSITKHASLSFVAPHCQQVLSVAYVLSVPFVLFPSFPFFGFRIAHRATRMEKLNQFFGMVGLDAISPCFQERHPAGWILFIYDDNRVLFVAEVCE